MVESRDCGFGAAVKTTFPYILAVAPLSTKKVVELDLLEEYVYAGERRYRFRVRGTNIVVNVRADSIEEGIERAVEVLRKVGYLTS